MIRTTTWHAFTTETVIVGSNCSHHHWSFMVMQLCQMRAFLSSIHTNEKLKKNGFNHDYQHHTIKYIPAIPLINKKIKILCQFRCITTNNLSFDNKCRHPGRQPRPVCSTNNSGQVLNSLLFGELRHFVMVMIRMNQNSAILALTWTKRTSLQYRMHPFYTHYWRSPNGV